uniref:protein NinD n=1 Tax=Serratia quinivorans TaxID=137545 RepID=UPI0035C75C2B
MMQKMESCYRCGERKEADKFRSGQPYWHRWCIRCEATPIGSMPIRETTEHRR